MKILTQAADLSCTFSRNLTAAPPLFMSSSDRAHRDLERDGYPEWIYLHLRGENWEKLPKKPKILFGTSVRPLGWKPPRDPCSQNKLLNSSCLINSIRCTPYETADSSRQIVRAFEHIWRHFWGGTSHKALCFKMPPVKDKMLKKKEA